MKNAAQKKLIEALTTTHQNAATAYILAKNNLQDETGKKQIEKIAKKFNIKT